MWIRQEHFCLRIVSLANRAFFNMPVITRRFVDEFGEVAVFVRVRGVVIVETDPKPCKITLMFRADAGNQLFWGNAFLCARSMIGVPWVSSAHT